jgi:branched-chain amino acid transport system substrate-binding protein
MRKQLMATLAAAAVLSMAQVAGAQEILLGVVGPVTGDQASFGEQMKKGAEMAVADINAAGGLMGKKIKLMIEDDRCSDKDAVVAANKVADAKVAGVIGHFCSSASIPASQVYAKRGIIQITPASTNPKLTEQGLKNVFRSCGRDDAQGLVAGNYLAKTYKGKKVAIIHDKSTYGKGLADETKKAMNKAGLKEALYDSYTKGDKDFTALVNKLKAGGYAAVYVGGYEVETALIAKQAKEAGFATQIMGGDALETDEVVKIAGPAAEGMLFTFAPDPRKIPENAALVKKFNDAKYDPQGYTLYTYAAVQMWAEAYKKAGGKTDAASLGKALHGGTFNTAVGKLTIDAKGDVRNPVYVFYKFQGGKRVELSM